MHNAQIIKRRQTILLLCLALALMFVQGLKLHVHTYAHDHGYHEEGVISGHAHIDQAHSAHSVPDTEHHDEVLSEVDLLPEGLLKNLSFGALVIALLTTALMVFLAPPFCTRITWRDNRGLAPVPWRNALRPPLRAPPR